MTDLPVKEYPYCFGCGASNPIGLRLALRAGADCLVAEFAPREEHQGWPGIVHGGIISSLLYEVMENFAYHNGEVAMMKSMSTRFRKPANVGERIIARSWLVERSGREIEVSASLTTEQDEVLAESNAVLVVLSGSATERLGIAG